jgi:hypothetical protein
MLDRGRVAGPITGSGPDADAPQHRLHRLWVGGAGGRFLPSPTAAAAAVLNDIATITTAAIADKIAAVTAVITVTIAVAVATVRVAVATVAPIKWVTVVTAVAAIEPMTVVAAVVPAIESMTVVTAVAAIKPMTVIAAVVAAIKPVTVIAAAVAAIKSMTVIATVVRPGVSRSAGNECDSRSEYNGNSAQHQRHDTSPELILRSNRTCLIV